MTLIFGPLGGVEGVEGHAFAGGKVSAIVVATVVGKVSAMVVATVSTGSTGTAAALTARAAKTMAFMIADEVVRATIMRWFRYCAGSLH